MEPSQKDIDAVKAKFPTRSVHLVVMDVCGEELHFLMTGPDRIEVRKFLREVEEAGSSVEKSLDACERAALAQIRWPARSEVEALFDAHPVIVKQFADKLQEFAGVSAEVRAKKL